MRHRYPRGMAHLYFNETLPPDRFTEGAYVEVEGEEARHAVRVSRLREGERIAVGNGAGCIATGTVAEIQKDRFSMSIEEVRGTPPKDPRVVLVQALAKGDRAERAVEQACEFGVDAIIPWEAERSVSRWSGAQKVERGVQKWQRVSREASKQSLRAWIPQVHEPMSIAALATIATRDTAELVVLHPGCKERLSASSCAQMSGLETIYLVIGPEGGISEAELAELQAARALVRSLGDTVLRTSSAGPAALSVLNVLLGRW